MSVIVHKMTVVGPRIKRHADGQVLPQRERPAETGVEMFQQHAAEDLVIADHLVQ